MEYGNIPGIDKPISRLVQGTVMISTDKLDESFALLDAALEAGVTTFDTAHGYGGGECDRTLGAWVNDRGIRDKVVILGKGAHHNRDRERVTPFDITADLHDSLARMKLDFIDLYVLHRDDPKVPVGPIVEVLNEHHNAGLIGPFGGSNWSPARLQEANEYADKHGLKPFAVSSPNFSLAVQLTSPWPNCLTISGSDYEADRAWYAERNMPLFTWSSLAGGFLTGRFTRDNLDTFDSYGDKLVVECYCTDENFQRLDRVKELAAEKGMSIPQIATAYIMSVPLNVFALVAPRNAQEIQDNVAAVTTRLTPAEIAWLELRAGER